MTTETQKPKKSIVPIFLGFILFLFVLGSYAGLFWLWQMQKTQTQSVNQTVSQSLKGYQGDSQQGLAMAKQADERSVELQAKTLVLEEKIADLTAQQSQTQTTLTQMNAQASDALINEVSHLVNMADQQLKFAGNIKAAIMALEAADLPLAQSGAPEYLEIRTSLGNDLAALKAFPALDMAALSNQLTSVQHLLDGVPLLQDQNGIEDHAQETEKAAEAPVQQSTIQSNLWTQFKQFIMIEKIDAPAQPLVNVEQKFYLKENLKLRLLTARIALMQRNADVFKQDLEAIRLWVTQYYDTQHPNAEKAMSMIQGLLATELGVALPNVQASLDAIAQYQSSKEAQDD